MAVMQEQLLIALLSLEELEDCHMRCLHQHKPDSSTIDVLVGGCFAEWTERHNSKTGDRGVG